MLSQEQQIIEEQFRNAVEKWSLYDTVMVGEGQDQVNGAKWYADYAALGNENEIPFLNQRNRSTVGVPYNSIDSAEQIPFAFKCESIGVQFSCTPFLDANPQGTPGITMLPNYSPVAFVNELLKHCAIRLQVSQDEKLLANVLAVPDGTGRSGYWTGFGVDQVAISEGAYNGGSNGSPRMANRWIFPEPVRIPRNRNIAAWLIFSNYAREMLKQMVGPGRFVINPAFVDPQTQAPTYESTTHPSVAMMRLTMFGKREVQQRNDLHFG